MSGRSPVYEIKGSVNPADWNTVPVSDSHKDVTWDSVSADWSQNGYSLATDLEWRLAALGGHDTPNAEFAGDPNPTSSGDSYDEYTWINTIALGEGDPDYGPHMVGTKMANECGLYDMTGNVSEWVWDWSTTNRYYLDDETNYRGPVNPGEGTTRLLNSYAARIGLCLPLAPMRLR